MREKIIIAILILCMIFSGCGVGDSSSAENVSSLESSILNSLTKDSSVETSSEETSSAEEEVIILDDGYEGFISVDQNKLVDENGKEYYIKGIAFGNDVFGNPLFAPGTHHDEDSYRGLAEMGFNSVRFYLNYRLFEYDDEPYDYRDTGFNWIDTNIKMAKKYGIRLVLNMHYPQGGYQSSGAGYDLWLEEENMKRLTALWAEIAERYKDEPTILGYGLINEPSVVVNDHAETEGIYRKAVQGMIDAIREVNDTQMIFLEKICSVQTVNQLGRKTWPTVTDNDNFILVDDDNTVYEFHFYDPPEYTHQGASGGEGFVYPNESRIFEMGSSSNIASAKYEKADVKNTNWQILKTEPIVATEDNQIINFNITTAFFKDNTTAYIDDMILEEYDENGKLVNVLMKNGFETESVISFWGAGRDVKSKFVLTMGNEKKGCCAVTGVKNIATSSQNLYKATKGHSYVASIAVKLLGTQDTTTVYPLVTLLQSDDYTLLNKEYLRQRLDSVISFAKEHNVPLYCGEFGADAECFKKDRGGDIWVADMLDILIEEGVHFNYHAYHEPMFGLYSSYPSKINEDLYKVFCDKLK